MSFSGTEVTNKVISTFLLNAVLILQPTDVDECENSTLFSCEDLTSCVNTDGSYTCHCQEGYFKNTLGLCQGERYILHFYT